MKKNYISPDMQVVAMKSTQAIMTNSIQVEKTETKGFDSSLGRGGIFDDSEE